MKTAQRQDQIANVAVTYTSPAFTVEQMVSFSAQFIPSAAVSGSLILQESNNVYQPPIGNDIYLIESPTASWEPIPSSLVTLTASTGYMYNYESQSSMRYVRLVWTPSAGTGTAVINWWAKGRI